MVFKQKDWLIQALNTKQPRNELYCKTISEYACGIANGNSVSNDVSSDESVCCKTEPWPKLTPPRSVDL